MGNVAFSRQDDPAVLENIQRSYFRPQEIRVIQNYLDPFKNPSRESIEEKLRGLSKQAETGKYVRGTILIGMYIFVLQNKFVPPQFRKFYTYNRAGQETTAFMRAAKKVFVAELATIVAMMPMNFHIFNQYTEIQVEREKIDADYFKQIGPIESQVIKDFGKILDNEYQFRKEMITNNFSWPEDYLNQSDLNNIKKAQYTKTLERSAKIRSHQPIVTPIIKNVMAQTNQGEIGTEKRLRTFAEITANRGGETGLGEQNQTQHFENSNGQETQGWCEKSSSEENKPEYTYVDPYEARRGKKKWD